MGRDSEPSLDQGPTATTVDPFPFPPETGISLVGDSGRRVATDSGGVQGPDGETGHTQVGVAVGAVGSRVDVHTRPGVLVTVRVGLAHSGHGGRA